MYFHARLIKYVDILDALMMGSLLLVEDNAKLARYLKGGLIEAGYEIVCESRGDKAVYRIVREQPDLVILDIMLPGMQGDQICHTVHGESYVFTAAIESSSC